MISIRNGDPQHPVIIKADIRLTLTTPPHQMTGPWWPRSRYEHAWIAHLLAEAEGFNHLKLTGYRAGYVNKVVHLNPSIDFRLSFKGSMLDYGFGLTPAIFNVLIDNPNPEDWDL